MREKKKEQKEKEKRKETYYRKNINILFLVREKVKDSI